MTTYTTKNSETSQMDYFLNLRMKNQFIHRKKEQNWSMEKA